MLRLFFGKHIGSRHDNRNLEKPQNAEMIEFTRGVSFGALLRSFLGCPHMRDQQKYVVPQALASED